jgi:cytochrome c-type biogenesis protein CcmI
MLTFFVALTVVSLGYFVAWPLLQDAAPSPVQAAPQPLHDEREAVQRALAELEFDRSTGKINDEDWQAARASLEARLSQFDADAADQNLSARDVELEIEIHITRARRRLKPSTV